MYQHLQSASIVAAGPNVQIEYITMLRKASGRADGSGSRAKTKEEKIEESFSWTFNGDVETMQCS